MFFFGKKLIAIFSFYSVIVKSYSLLLNAEEVFDFEGAILVKVGAVHGIYSS